MMVGSAAHGRLARRLSAIWFAMTPVLTCSVGPVAKRMPPESILSFALLVNSPAPHNGSLGRRFPTFR